MGVDFVSLLESVGYRVLEVLAQPLDGRSSSSLGSIGIPASADLGLPGLTSPSVEDANRSTAIGTPLGQLGRSPLSPAPASATTQSSPSTVGATVTGKTETGKTLRRLPLITQRRLPTGARLVVSGGFTAMSSTIHQLVQVDIDERGKAWLHVCQAWP